MAAARRIEEIEDRERLMHAHQRFAVRTNLALDQRQMHVIRSAVGVSVQGEFAMHRLDRLRQGALDQRLVAAAVVNQIGDGADLDVVRAGEFDQIGQTRHRAVVLEHFANHRCRLKPGQLGEIATGFGMSGAHQHATFACDDREGVSRHHEIGRLGVARHRRLHGACAILRRDARRHAFSGFDRGRECGAVRARIVVCHLHQTELAGACFGDRQADETACVRHHEIDRLRRHVVGGQDDIAFVFAIFIVNQNDHAPGADFNDDFLDRRNGRRFALW